MTIELYKWPDAVDYDDVVNIIQTTHGVDVRDFAGRHTEKARAWKEEKKAEWLKENGYEGKAYVLNKPEGSDNDWGRDSPEMILRIEINTKMRDSGFEAEFDKVFPYQDFWHRHCGEVSRGGVNYMYLGNDEDTPEWVKQINSWIIEIVKDSPAYDTEEMTLTYTVDW